MTLSRFHINRPSVKPEGSDMFCYPSRGSSENPLRKTQVTITKGQQSVAKERRKTMAARQTVADAEALVGGNGLLQGGVGRPSTAAFKPSINTVLAIDEYLQQGVPISRFLKRYSLYCFREMMEYVAILLLGSIFWSVFFLF